VFYRITRESIFVLTMRIGGKAPDYGCRMLSRLMQSMCELPLEREKKMKRSRKYNLFRLIRLCKVVGWRQASRGGGYIWFVDSTTCTFARSLCLFQFHILSFHISRLASSSYHERAGVLLKYTFHVTSRSAKSKIFSRFFGRPR
jgi:hypothetical protein